MNKIILLVVTFSSGYFVSSSASSDCWTAANQTLLYINASAISFADDKLNVVDGLSISCDEEKAYLSQSMFTGDIYYISWCSDPDEDCYTFAKFKFKSASFERNDRDCIFGATHAPGGLKSIFNIRSCPISTTVAAMSSVPTPNTTSDDLINSSSGPTLLTTPSPSDSPIISEISGPTLMVTPSPSDSPTTSEISRSSYTLVLGIPIIIVIAFMAISVSTIVSFFLVKYKISKSNLSRTKILPKVDDAFDVNFQPVIIDMPINIPESQESILYALFAENSEHNILYAQEKIRKVMQKDNVSEVKSFPSNNGNVYVQHLHHQITSDADDDDDTMRVDLSLHHQSVNQDQAEDEESQGYIHENDNNDISPLEYSLSKNVDQNSYIG